MKYLLLLLVVLLAVAWFSIGRRRRDGNPPAGGGSARREPVAPTMVACAHCGVHLPQPDALFDAAGRPFCSEAHRLAGPR
jgi:uncharacterized protein